MDLSQVCRIKRAALQYRRGKWLLDKWDNSTFDSYCKSSWKFLWSLPAKKEVMVLFIPIFYTFSLPSYPVSISPSLTILCFFPSVLSLLSSLIKQLPFIFSFIYFPAGEQQQQCLLCMLRLHSLPSFSSQLRLSSSSSVLLSWDSHSKEPPQLSSLSRLRNIMEGRQVDTGRREMCHTHCSQPFWRS